MFGIRLPQDAANKLIALAEASDHAPSAVARRLLLKSLRDLEVRGERAG